MSISVIIGFLKAIVPTKKLGAWILAVAGAALAVFMGISNSDLKASYCAADPVTLPAVVAPVAPQTK